jgi:hypothetical protein
MTRRASLPRLTLSALAVLSPAFAAGCNQGPAGSPEEPTAANRNATVEYRPVLTAGGNAVHKQRSGKLKRVTAEWVVIDEGGVEMWIPKDMVLEIRMNQ